MKKAKYRQIYKIDHFTFTFAFAMCCLSQRQQHTASIRRTEAEDNKRINDGLSFWTFWAEIFLEKSQNQLLYGFYITFIWLSFLLLKAWTDWSALASWLPPPHLDNAWKDILARPDFKPLPHLKMRKWKGQRFENPNFSRWGQPCGLCIVEACGCILISASTKGYSTHSMKHFCPRFL